MVQVKSISYNSYQNTIASVSYTHLDVYKRQDMGRVIGKQGRIAKAIRVVMRAAAVRVDEDVYKRQSFRRARRGW